MNFVIESQDLNSKARAGVITTKNGKISTPIFMPVGTGGTVKAVNQQQLYAEINADIILGNTYHLYLRPGLEVLNTAGGLHNFMNWNRPILTDSGGYQVYSLAKKRKITEKGVSFKSHIDGSDHMFTPESVVGIQRVIGSNIMMVFDECTPYPCSYAYAKSSMERTHRWLNRCINAFNLTLSEENSYQEMFPIVQGSIYKDLRKESAQFVSEANRFGNAIGGVCHPDGMLYEITSCVCDILPQHKPRYLMGVGTPLDLLECISLGVDMFDCVMPTRNGRNGTLFTNNGIINIKNKKWKNDFTCIDDTLGETSRYYSKAYLNHLFHAKEILGVQIASVHNLSFYLSLVKNARKHIIYGDFVEWKNKISKVISEKL